MPNALAVKWMEVSEQKRREYMERRLKSWGRWRVFTANEPKLGLEGKPNLIHRLMGKPYDPPPDWSPEEEINHFVSIITLLRPARGAALHAKYSPSPMDEYKRFNQLMIDGGHGNRAKRAYYDALRKGRDDVYGFLNPPVD